ncbi:hypothetical protein [Shewanella dokdonensis]|uniref:HPr kinase n=1 Tax=Shewanella dokdonensis TaxID=712036 RepID=A0ABX8DFU6_9GAMM|nr:hypothetical protein [Shewanella dokdonensis]MCL1073825.1 hypothetical protein [Shewanella dokdonensis]QVK23612.1 hypothetical protein KHX94_02445 [Shewanella dokdonensis]
MYYSAYQLTIASELPLPELVPVNGTQTDVTIRFDNVAKNGLADGEQLGPFLWAAPNTLWLQVPNVARFLVRNGNEIIIDPADGIDDDSIRVFLLGSAFGALLFQRGLLVIHGNAVRIGDECLICVGPSGAGKSTLAAAFMQRGFDVLADDVVPVNDAGLALPGFPRIKLWQDAAEQFEIVTDDLRRIRPEMNKFNLPVNGVVQQALPIRWIYILGSDHIDEITFEAINGMAKFMPLQNNTYRAKFLHGMQLKPQHLSMCGKLASKIRLSRLTRPKLGFTANAMVDAILKDIEVNP